MNKKWIIYTGLGLIAFLLVVIFSKNIWNWFENWLVTILIYAIVFGVGWVLGYFSGRSSRDRKNAKNITKAQE